MQNTKKDIRPLILCSIFAALTAVCSQILIPLPMVSINLALFAVHLAAAILGAKYGGLSMLVYVLLGLVGAPVFTGFTGGVGILFGKTGGYILGYILSAFITGFLCRKWGRSFGRMCAAMALGVIVCYAFGTAWVMLVTGTPFLASLVYCVFPFLPGDAAKILLAAFLAGRLYPVCVRNRWISA